jgi:hypothetical protein
MKKIAENRFLCMNLARNWGTMNMMMRTLSILLLFSVSLFGGAGVGVASAAENLPSTHEEALLALINQARQNPLTVAASLGMDPEKILKDLPELETILKEGLPAVTFNGYLYEAARAHTQDMFSNGYYSHDSPDGRGYDARIKNSGYPAFETGESLGMLAFANFIDPGNAVKRLFEYMFRDELDPTRTEKRNILNPLLKEAGVSIDTGVLSLGGALWNVYLATCDYGAVNSGPETKLLRLINQARENPLKAAASAGMDPEKVLADFPALHDLLTQGLPPLTVNLGLSKAARAHAEDMLANGYFSSNSLDGRTVKDRMRENGYDPLDAGEYIRIQCLGNDFKGDDDLIDRTVGIIFNVFLTRELSPYNTEQRNILNAGLKEIGISLVTGTSSKLGGICGNSVLLMVTDFGLRSE